MKLFYATASPFARKVVVCIHELGLEEAVEIVSAAVTPVAPNADINAVNSIGKIPTLVLGDGSGLFDSRVICEHLDTLSNSATIFPTARAERISALRLQAVGDGICDTAVALRYETFLRPEEFRWAEFIESQKVRLLRTIQQVEDQYLDDLKGVHIGAIAVASALGYLDFRMPDLGWRDGRPGIAAWYEEFSQRPSMANTVPE